METREVFWSLGTTAIRLFYLLGFTAVAVFLWGCWHHIAKYRRGRDVTVPVNLWTGIIRMVSDVFSHRSMMRRDRFAGLGHVGIFYGFLISVIGTTIIAIELDLCVSCPFVGFTHLKYFQVAINENLDFDREIKF